MQKWAKLLISLVIVSWTAGCVNISAINWVKPICPSKNDVLTEGTKQQIVTHDETLGKPCK